MDEQQATQQRVDQVGEDAGRLAVWQSKKRQAQPMACACVGGMCADLGGEQIVNLMTYMCYARKPGSAFRGTVSARASA